jgi:hypothetical protein
MKLTQKRISHYLARYGADTSQWPVDLRKKLPPETDAQWRALLAEERRLTRFLLERHPETIAPDLEKRILRAALDAPRPRLRQTNPGGWVSRVFPGLRLSRPALSFAAILSLGFLIGLTQFSLYVFDDTEPSSNYNGNLTEDDAL